MDITMIGLHNAGKTSLLRVLAVSYVLSDVPISLLVEDLFVTEADVGFEGRRVHH